MSNESLSSITLINFSNYTGNVVDFNTYYYYFFLHPIVTMLAFLSNSVCAIVFAQRELRTAGPFFQYSLANSIISALGMIVASGMCLSRCGPLCSLSNSYESQVYELFGVMFLCNSIFFASSLIQIAISFQLYLSITQK